jgi:hypothetical protein
MTKTKTFRVRCVKAYGTATVGQIFETELKGRQLFIIGLPTWTAQPILILKDGKLDKISRSARRFELVE